jgi:hypothetical protein
LPVFIQEPDFHKLLLGLFHNWFGIIKHNERMIILIFWLILEYKQIKPSSEKSALVSAIQKFILFGKIYIMLKYERS